MSFATATRQKGSVRAGGTWLVTGAAGQVARSVLALAPDLGVQVAGRTRAELDISEASAVRAVLDEVQPEVVLNCAAFTQVDLCEEQAEEAERVNARGPGVLAQECASSALLVHLSTEYVFAGDTPTPISEEQKPGPLSSYGRSKLAGEEAVREAAGEHLIVRTQWVFGPGPCFVRTMLEAARQGRNLRVVEDQIGRPTWTGALARGLIQSVALGARGILHLACEGVASWYDLAQASVQLGAEFGMNPAVDVHPVSTGEFPRPAPRPAYAVLGLERARQLGVELPHWRDALASYLAAERGGRDA